LSRRRLFFKLGSENPVAERAAMSVPQGHDTTARTETL
jgi:hypothetical protein